MGRRSARVRNCFRKTTVLGKKQAQQQCIGCSSLVADVAARLLSHADMCKCLRDQGRWKDSSSKQMKFPAALSKAQSDDIHEAIARFVFSHNLSFQTVITPTFNQLLNTLRPGVKPLSVHILLSRLLPQIWQTERQKFREELSNAFVTMSVDGWSNPTNKSVLAIAINDDLAFGLDMHGLKHTIDNLTTIMHDTLAKVDAEFPSTTVCGIVTDSAANMAGMRRHLLESEQYFVYACQAHLANLVITDYISEKKHIAVM